MMLKINKTLPKNKTRCNNQRNISRVKCANYLGLAALICGIMPGLMGLNNYNSYSNKAYAAEVKTLSDITTMQEMTTEICTNSAKFETHTLRDTRDNSEYEVTKLSDYNCWMTENLQLTKESMEAAGNQAELNSSNSNMSTGTRFTMPTSITKNSIVPTDFSNSNYYVAQIYKPSSIDTNWQSEYGAYYSWTAAIAGGSLEETPIDKNAENDICPKGWQLPGRYDYSPILKLVNPSDSITPEQELELLQSSPYKYSLGGHIENGILVDAGTAGRYWSKTKPSTTNTSAFRLRLDNERIGVVSAERFRGNTIRCMTESYPQKDANISVLVSPTLTLDAVTGAEDIEADPSSIAYGTITATISSNTNYIVQLSSNNPNLTDPINHPDIEGIEARSNVVKGTNAWGIQNNLNDNTRLSDYSPITTTPTSFYSTEQYNEETKSTTHTFTLGVSIANTLPSGEYSTTVTVTAVNN